MISSTLKFVLVALCLLLVPLIAMIFHWSDWDWTVGDFAVAAILLALFGASLAYATGRTSAKHRIFGAIFVVVVLLVYVHLAVGIVDWLPFAGN